MNPLFVGIDVSSKNNVAYLMKPDGSKHSSFSVQNNLGGAKILSERIVSALEAVQLSDVVIGLEATLRANAGFDNEGKLLGTQLFDGFVGTAAAFTTHFRRFA